MDRLGPEATTILLTVVTVASISCRHHGEPPAPVLLFDGTGTSRGDVAAIESLLARVASPTTPRVPGGSIG